MTEFKAGDRVRYKADINGVLVGGSRGTVAEPSDYYGVRVQWDEGTMTVDGDMLEGDRTEPHSIQYVEPEYDQDTVNAIVKHLRDTLGYAGFAAEVEEAFAVPKTRTVTVNFQVPEGKSVVDYLENVGIDYDIEGGN